MPQSTKPVPRIGVGVIVRRGEDVLLVRRHNTHGAGTWSTPGGHLDFGEDPQTCAAREAFEETGVRVERIRFRALTNDIFEPEGKHYLTVWMEGVYAEGEAYAKATEELSEVAWFRWDALPAPLFLSLQRLVDGNTVGREGGRF